MKIIPKRSIWLYPPLVVILLILMVAYGIVEPVAAKYATEFSYPDLITIPKNYYSVTYYDSDGTTVLNSAENEKIQNYLGTAYTVVDTYNDEVTIPDGAVFKAWVNAGGQTVTVVDSNNTEDILLYPSFTNIYTARFMDMTGNEVLKSVTFTNSTDISELTQAAPPTIEVDAEGDDYTFEEWQVRNSDGTYTALANYNLANATGDIVIIPNFTYEGSMALNGVDEDGDGDIDYYIIETVSELSSEVTIPGYIYAGSSAIPVKVVTDLTGSNWADDVQSIVVQEGVERIESGAFADTPSLQEVYLPNSLEYLGSSAFVNNGGLGFIGGLISYKTPEITYNGTRAEWNALIAKSASNWDNNLGAGTTVVCLDGTYTLTGNYGSRTWVWQDKATQ